jgi:hypothetical protein
MVKIIATKKWNLIVDYAKKDRSDLKKIRVARPVQSEVLEAMDELIINMKFVNC